MVVRGWGTALLGKSFSQIRKLFIYDCIQNVRITILENLFTSKTRTRILGVLILNSNREFHLREIARKIDITPTYVKKELKNLQKLNLILTSNKGNLSLFQINSDSVIYDELKSIFMKTEYFGELLKKSLNELKIDFAFIFGSFAKGIENTESDIDLFVVGDVDENDLLTIIQEIERKTKREINYIVWKKADLMERAKKHHLLNEIAKNPVIMLVGDENEFRKIIE